MLHSVCPQLSFLSKLGRLVTRSANSTNCHSGSCHDHFFIFFWHYHNIFKCDRTEKKIFGGEITVLSVITLGSCASSYVLHSVCLQLSFLSKFGRLMTRSTNESASTHVLANKYTSTHHSASWHGNFLDSFDILTIFETSNFTIFNTIFLRK